MYWNSEQNRRWPAIRTMLRRLRELAELMRADGKRADALAALKRAFELSPDDPLTREMLADLLLEALASDFAAYRAEMPLVKTLVRDRAQQIELIRIEAEGLHQLADHRGAWDAYLRLAELTAEDAPLLNIDNQHSVRSDRWISGRLRDLWSKAADDERAEFANQLDERRERLTDAETAAELRHFLSHFEALPGGMRCAESWRSS